MSGRKTIEETQDLEVTHHFDQVLLLEDAHVKFAVTSDDERKRYP